MSKQTKYETGKWYREGARVFTVEPDRPRRGVRVDPNPMRWRIWANVDGHNEVPAAEIETAARMFFAAPDLLAALKGLLREVSAGDVCRPACRPGVDQHEADCPEFMARAALKKAEGK